MAKIMLFSRLAIISTVVLLYNKVIPYPLQEISFKGARPDFQLANLQDSEDNGKLSSIEKVNSELSVNKNKFNSVKNGFLEPHINSEENSTPNEKFDKRTSEKNFTTDQIVNQLESVLWKKQTKQCNEKLLKMFKIICATYRVCVLNVPYAVLEKVLFRNSLQVTGKYQTSIERDGIIN